MVNSRTATVLASMMIFSAAVYAEDIPGIAIPPTIQSEVKALGCDACHGWERTKFGPSWQNVADRYRNQTTYVYKGFNINSVGEKLPLVQGLVTKISKGGKGEWNEYIPMAPNDPNGIHAKEITNIVNFILSVPPKK
ncbi:cytochrome c-551 precursor [mine drainage metagenome]|uniref:Cytochrome c-551 n=1 Tax=mine drainage metagenome TaxID=410659 RepID=A0A1J5SKX9_9ZZZZ